MLCLFSVELCMRGWWDSRNKHTTKIGVAYRARSDNTWKFIKLYSQIKVKQDNRKILKATWMVRLFQFYFPWPFWCTWNTCELRVRWNCPSQHTPTPKICCNNPRNLEFATIVKGNIVFWNKNIDFNILTLSLSNQLIGFFLKILQTLKIIIFKRCFSSFPR